MFVRYQTVTVIKKGETVIDPETGLFSDQSEIKKHIKANIQAVKGRKLDKLPEGRRLEDFKTMYAHERLQEDDILEWNCSRYVIEDTVDWTSNQPHNYYEYTLQKEDLR